MHLILNSSFLNRWKLCTLKLLPALADFPSNDPVADTEKYVAVLEKHIRQCPEQYYWIHRKFKNRPAPLPDAYSDLDSLK